MLWYEYIYTFILKTGVWQAVSQSTAPEVVPSCVSTMQRKSQESTPISWWQTKWSVTKWRYTDNACTNMCHTCSSLSEHVYISVSHNELILVITSHASAAVVPHQHYLGTSQWSWLGYVLCNVDTEILQPVMLFSGILVIKQYMAVHQWHI